MPVRIQIRAAVEADIPVLRELIDTSVRRLQSGDYTPQQIDAALRTVFGVDSQLIADGTYLLAEASIEGRATPVIAGCGGWSKRRTLYGGDSWQHREDDLLDPVHDAAKIRAFFIHPDYARQGVATMILDACEDAASAAGFSRYEMGATLTGVKFFRQRGYVAVEAMDIPLECGITLPIVHMVKQAQFQP
jgi:GNAT superfamily N-acetyltransferase